MNAGMTLLDLERACSGRRERGRGRGLEGGKLGRRWCWEARFNRSYRGNNGKVFSYVDVDGMFYL